MSEQIDQAPVGYGIANATMLHSLKTKKVRKFARLGWNGKQLYVQAHGSFASSDVKLANGETAYVDSFFVIVNEATGRVNTWVPSSSDLQAEDWVEV